MKKRSILELRREKVEIRMNEFKSLVRAKSNTIISDYDISKFLKSAMNFTEMQTWLLDMRIKNAEVTDLDLYEKLFDLKTTAELVSLYDKYLEKQKEERMITRGGIRKR